MLTLEYLKEIGFVLKITRHKYSVELNGVMVARGWPLWMKRSAGVRQDLANNLREAHKAAEEVFWRINFKELHKEIDEGINLNEQ
jgi:hypothetical protein